MLNENTSGPIVVALGEILWDLLPSGRKLGGAPANFACHVAGLGGESVLISAVGEDELGREAVARFAELGVETSQIQADSQHPTGTVDVTIDNQGFASYRFASDAAWDHLRLEGAVGELLQRADALCFGTLGQRAPASRLAIEQMVIGFRGRTGSKLCVLDINFRPPHVDDQVIRSSLELANVLKLNETELPELMQRLYETELASLDETAVTTALRRLAADFGLRWIALTLGSEGAMLLSPEGKLFRARGLKVSVRDTVGAGDAFTAALVLGLLQAIKPQTILDRACEVAAYVCSHEGATPPLPHYLRF